MNDGPFRTLLFAPGNHARKVEKVFDAGADAVILDLEDAVAIAEKPATRAVVVEALKRPRACRGYVRVNATDTDWCYGDIQAVAGASLDGIVLPKVESASQLLTIDWLLAQIERERGLTTGSIDIIPIIETGPGQKALAEIAGAGSRVRRLSFGAGDYTLDMGIVWTLEETELAAMRAAMVLESRSAGLEPPIDTVHIHLNETEAFRASCATDLTMGFQGKLCIHPGQIAVANGTFTPSAEAVVYARKVVDAFEAAEAAGSASIQVDGYFVDYPIVEKARRTLALMATIEAAESGAPRS